MQNTQTKRKKERKGIDAKKDKKGGKCVRVKLLVWLRLVKGKMAKLSLCLSTTP
jgi:hypothetical protein